MARRMRSSSSVAVAHKSRRIAGSGFERGHRTPGVDGLVAYLAIGGQRGGVGDAFEEWRRVAEAATHREERFDRFGRGHRAGVPAHEQSGGSVVGVVGEGAPRFLQRDVQRARLLRQRGEAGGDAALVARARRRVGSDPERARDPLWVAEGDRRPFETRQCFGIEGRGLEQDAARVATRLVITIAEGEANDAAKQAHAFVQPFGLGEPAHGVAEPRLVLCPGPSEAFEGGRRFFVDGVVLQSLEVELHRALALARTPAQERGEAPNPRVAVLAVGARQLPLRGADGLVRDAYALAQMREGGLVDGVIGDRARQLVEGPERPGGRVRILGGADAQLREEPRAPLTLRQPTCALERVQRELLVARVEGQVVEEAERFVAGGLGGERVGDDVEDQLDAGARSLVGAGRGDEPLGAVVAVRSPRDRFGDHRFVHRRAGRGVRIDDLVVQRLHLRRVVEDHGQVVGLEVAAPAEAGALGSFESKRARQVRVGRLVGGVTEHGHRGFREAVRAERGRVLAHQERIVRVRLVGPREQGTRPSGVIVDQKPRGALRVAHGVSCVAGEAPNLGGELEGLGAAIADLRGLHQGVDARIRIARAERRARETHEGRLLPVLGRGSEDRLIVGDREIELTGRRAEDGALLERQHVIRVGRRRFPVGTRRLGEGRQLALPDARELSPRGRALGTARTPLLEAQDVALDGVEGVFEARGDGPEAGLAERRGVGGGRRTGIEARRGQEGRWQSVAGPPGGHDRRGALGRRRRGLSTADDAREPRADQRSDVGGAARAHRQERRDLLRLARFDGQVGPARGLELMGRVLPGEELRRAPADDACIREGRASGERVEDEGDERDPVDVVTGRLRHESARGGAAFLVERETANQAIEPHAAPRVADGVRAQRRRTDERFRYRDVRSARVLHRGREGLLVDEASTHDEDFEALVLLGGGDVDDTAGLNDHPSATHLDATFGAPLRQVQEQPGDGARRQPLAVHRGRDHTRNFGDLRVVRGERSHSTWTTKGMVSTTRSGPMKSGAKSVTWPSPAAAAASSTRARLRSPGVSPAIP